eukprot:CAMPEP_0170512894 /NCGR_PEP_ID=MMETSP0208-20121228/67103_1 /TAXON_ID=197538 /ORGANISM="Strombidium inclinatum, Strain S3" /LENGTH=64 /DNA_ID=CAMNT_0010796573 /DNA_START=1065 /DNA_END=1259 /DNA_ORIENTATION=+
MASREWDLLLADKPNLMEHITRTFDRRMDEQGFAEEHGERSHPMMSFFNEMSEEEFEEFMSEDL